jgi:hypothetical protein
MGTNYLIVYGQAQCPVTNPPTWIVQSHRDTKCECMSRMKMNGKSQCDVASMAIYLYRGALCQECRKIEAEPCTRAA